MMKILLSNSLYSRDFHKYNLQFIVNFIILKFKLFFNKAAASNRTLLQLKRRVES